MYSTARTFGNLYSHVLYMLRVNFITCMYFFRIFKSIYYAFTNTHKDFTHRLASEMSIFRLVGPVCHSLICIGTVKPISFPEPANYGACSTKMKTLERTGSKSPQIVNLLNCITFQTTAQHCLRIGPFQSPFSLSMARHVRS